MSFKLYRIAAVRILLLFCFVYSGSDLYPQVKKADFTAESKTAPRGYITSPVETPYGIVCTNEFSSALYLIKNGEMKEIIAAPGCGRYFTFSPDKKLVGFKYIDPATRLQSPAVIKLQSLQIEKLWTASELCGQPSFANDGTVVFTVGNQLIFSKGSDTKQFDLGLYSNRTPVSPDGKYVIYNNDDQLWKFEPATGRRELLTDNKAGYGDAQWSFDGSKISFQSIDARILVRDLNSSKTVVVSKGENAVWAPDANRLVFHWRDIDMTNFNLNNSDVYLYDAASGKLSNVTNTPDKFEMDASFSGSDVVYHTFGEREILKASNAARSVIFKSAVPVDIPAFKELEAEKTVSAAASDTKEWDYVHIHQVFHTGTNDLWYSSGEGHRCCGATSSMQALASYKILPPDPIYSYGYNVYSPYGKYITDPYTYNGITYSGYNGSWPSGIHGLFWNTGSPYSNIVQFLNNHGITSSMNEWVTWTAAMTEINMGYPYIVCSTGLTGGHIVMIVKQYGAGHTVYVNDPYGDKNPSGYDHSKIDGKNAIYDWSDANTGHQKITPLPWAVNARYARRVQLYTTYPQNKQKDMATDVAVKLQFSDPIVSSSVASNISLLDKQGNNVAFRLDTTGYASGLVIVEPASLLSENSEYRVVVKPDLQSTNTLTVLKEKEFSFTTGSKEAAVNGRTVENFEDAASWPDPNTNKQTVGTNAEKTYFALDKDHAIDGLASGKLAYTFSSTLGGFCFLKNAKLQDVGASADSSFGIWVFGDASKNLIGYWFYDEQQQEKRVYVDTLNWTGWKFRHIQLNSISETGKKYFAGIIIKQVPKALQSGQIYIDQASLILTAVRVNSYSPMAKTKVDTLSPVIVEFNKAMDKAKCQKAFSMTPAVTGSFVWENNDTRMKFIPASPLKSQTLYTVTMDTTAADVNGLNLKVPYSFSFQTTRVRLMLVKNYPAKQSNDISRTVQIRLNFDGAIDALSLSGNISMTDAADKAVSVKVNAAHYSEGIIAFAPAKPLAANSLYKIKLKSGIKDTEKLLLGEYTEIQFTTEADNFVDGAIADSFETVNNWIQPALNEQSNEVEPDATVLSLSTAVKCTGVSSGKLAYKFFGSDGLCVLEKASEQQVSTDGNTLFGMWIHGDLSGNILEYHFRNSSGQLVKYVVDTVNWTGWKIKNVVMKDKAIQAFRQIAIRQTGTSDLSGELYFDNLQFGANSTAVDEVTGLPVEYSLSNNYPNPFNPSTMITYSLPFAGRVVLKVYDILGTEVATLVNDVQQAGTHNVRFDVSGYNLASGVYFYRINASAPAGAKNFMLTKKMMLIK
ncbi:MAG: Ig-like domain-containing protein [Bacteroidota bacterium]